MGFIKSILKSLAMLQLWQHVTTPTFWLPVCSSHLISVHPNWRRHATKKVRSFIPCHFIIFGERSDPPRICESQTTKISVPDLALEDCARVLKIQNGGHKTLNRCEGSLCECYEANMSTSAILDFPNVTLHIVKWNVPFANNAYCGLTTFRTFPTVATPSCSAVNKGG